MVEVVVPVLVQPIKMVVMDIKHQNFLGSPYYFAGGGGGSVYGPNNTNGGDGGLGGGGGGALNPSPASYVMEMVEQEVMVLMVKMVDQEVVE